MITPNDLKTLMQVMRSPEVRVDLTPERLLVVFGNHLGYPELVELLCRYINATELFMESNEGQEQLGAKTLEADMLRYELDSLNVRYQIVQKESLDAEKKHYAALNNAAKLQLENQMLQSKVERLALKAGEL